jgi:hypothetical protein
VVHDLGWLGLDVAKPLDGTLNRADATLRMHPTIQ